MKKSLSAITLLCIFGLSACTSISPKNKEINETATTETSVMFMFSDQQGNKLKDVVIPVHKMARTNFSFESNEFKYNVIIAQHTNSCSLYNNLNNFPQCKNKEQNILFARGTISQQSKNDINQPINNHDFRIINILDKSSTDMPKFNTNFKTENLVVNWNEVQTPNNQ